MMVSYLAIAILAATVPTAKPEPPQWESDYGKALEATREDEKPLLVVLDKPTETEARIEPSLLCEGAITGKRRKLLRPYRLCHVDVSTKYGKKVAKAFRAGDFPYTAIIDKSGSKIIFSKAGKMKSEQWDETLVAFKSGSRNARISHVVYKKSDDSLEFKDPGESSSSSSYCPTCRRKSG